MAEEAKIKILIDTANTAKNLKQVREALKAINSELVDMSANDEGFYDLAEAAGNLQDRIGDTRAVVNFFADDFGKIKGAIGIVEGLAGGFAVAQGAVALFGGESKELNEVLKKTQGTIAILNGLQAINAKLSKDSYERILLQTTAQKLYSLSVGTSTGALKAFRLALVATGVGAAIVAIGLLAANWDKFTAALGFSNNELEENKKKLEESTKALEEQRKALDEYLKTNQNVINRNIEIIKLEEKLKELNLDKTKNAKKIFETEQQILDLRLKQLRVELETKRGVLSLEDEFKIKAEIYRLEQERARSAISFEQQLREEREKTLKQAKEEQQKLAKELIDERIKAFIDGEEKEKALAREAARVRLAQIKGDGQVERDLRKLIKDNLERDIKAIDAKYREAERLEREKEAEEKRKQLEEFRKAEEEHGKQLLEIQRRLAEEKKAIRDAELQAAMDLTNGLTAILNAFGKDSAEYAAFSKTLALVQVGIETTKALSDLTTRATAAGTQAGVAAGAATAGIGAAPAAAAMSTATYISGAAQILGAIAKAKAVLQSTPDVTPPQFATGGFVIGAGTATSDSIPAWLSNGEFVVNAKSTSVFAPLLDAMNNMTLDSRFIQARNGGNNTSQNQVSPIESKQTIEVKAYVSEKEITDSQKRITKIERNGTIY